jgi:hypothetical protein
VRLAFFGIIEKSHRPWVAGNLAVGLPAENVDGIDLAERAPRYMEGRLKNVLKSQHDICTGPP